MRSDGVVVGTIRNWIPAQMFLTQDNDVVQTLAPDRSYKPFGKGGVLKIAARAYETLEANVPNLFRKHLIPVGGHWIVQERPAEVNELPFGVLDFRICM
jgi:hypothetical protein